MRLIFEKKLPILELITYLELEKEERHTDIQDYLEKLASGKSANTIFDTRVQMYLHQISLLEKQADGTYILSKKGQKTRETGLVPRKEAGTYKIWICPDFLNEAQPNLYKILYLERVANPKPASLSSKNNIQLCKQHALLDATKISIDPNHTKLELVDTISNTAPLNITLVWEWDCSNTDNNLWTTQYSYKNWSTRPSNLVNLSFAETYTPLRPLSKQIGSYLPNWEPQANRNEASFEKLSPSERINFTTAKQTIQPSNSFDRIEAIVVPLMPKNATDCENWRDWLVTNQLEKKYTNNIDFDSLLQHVNNHIAFKYFNQKLNTPKLLDFLPKCRGEKRAFWHLAAPFDLSL
jgi:hypothetical protein